MHSQLIEVSTAVVHTPDGESKEVFGGAYLPPESYLTLNAELNALRAREVSSVAPLLLAAGLIGVGLGYWFGRRDAD